MRKYTAVLFACVKTKSATVGCDGYVYVMPGDPDPVKCHIPGCGGVMYRVGEFELAS